MPVVDGYKILQSLQGTPDAPATYVLTNLSQPEDKAKALALGAKDFFVKSEMTLEEIINEIKEDGGTPA
jgi:CheY-like chemotaxis protein